VARRARKSGETGKTGERPAGWKTKGQPGFHLIRPEDTHRIRVGPECTGMRLDAFLAKKLRWRSRTSVQKLLREREILVSGQRRRASYRLREDDLIEIPLPPASGEALDIQKIPLDIIYEDDDIVVLNKQPGVVCHPVGRRRYNTLMNALHLRYRRPDDAEKDIVPRLAHRLDRDTSGVLLVCKTLHSRRHLYFQFEQRRVSKEYRAIVEGVIRPDAVRIDAALGKDAGSDIRLKRGVRRYDGASAVTDVRVLERFDGFSLVSARPHTGKQHQIRVHLAHVGHPVLCDPLYGRRSRLRLCDVDAESGGEEVLIGRHALHAYSLAFRHPVSKEDIEFIAPLPEDMERTLSAMRASRLRCRCQEPRAARRQPWVARPVLPGRANGRAATGPDKAGPATHEE